MVNAGFDNRYIRSIGNNVDISSKMGNCAKIGYFEHEKSSLFSGRIRIQSFFHSIYMN